MDIIFELDVMDSETPLSLDLTALKAQCVREEKIFPIAFHRAVIGHLVHTTDGGTEEGFDPVVYTMEISAEEGSIVIPVEGRRGGLLESLLDLGFEFDAILDYAGKPGVDDDRVIAYLGLIEREGWPYMVIDSGTIASTMQDFLGLFSDYEEILDELMARGELDEIPDWVIYDAEATAREAESQGYFVSAPIAGGMAAWS